MLHILEVMQKQFESKIHDSAALEDIVLGMPCSQCRDILSLVTNTSHCDVACRVPWLSPEDAKQFGVFFTEVGKLVDVLVFCSENECAQSRTKYRKDVESEAHAIQEGHAFCAKALAERRRLTSEIKRINDANHATILKLKKHARHTTSDAATFLLMDAKDINWSPDKWHRFSIKDWPPLLHSAACSKIDVILGYYGKDHASKHVHRFHSVNRVGSTHEMIVGLRSLSIFFSRKKRVSSFISHIKMTVSRSNSASCSKTSSKLTG